MLSRNRRAIEDDVGLGGSSDDGAAGDKRDGPGLALRVVDVRDGLDGAGHEVFPDGRIRR